MARKAGYMVSVVDMPQPELSEAQKRNAYGIKAEVLKDMVDKWEPFVHNRLVERTSEIGEAAEEDES